MSSPVLENASRRDFLRQSVLASGGLVLGSYLNLSYGAANLVAKPSQIANQQQFKPNAFIRIAANGIVTLIWRCSWGPV